MNKDYLESLLRAVSLQNYVFVPPTPETHRRVNARAGNEVARNLTDIFGWSRPFASEIIDGQIFELLRNADALELQGQLWRSRIRIASLNGRNYLHSAYPTSASNAVFFGPDTYRFVRAALGALPERAYPHVLDLGCGSGAGGIEVAAARDVDRLSLSDINPSALAFAKINATVAGRQATFVESDLFATFNGAFDLIIANPPYLADAEKRAYRDGGGRLGMDLGLRMVRESMERLNPDGVFFLYTGVPIIAGIDLFRQNVEQILRNRHYIYNYTEIDPDVFGEELEMPAYSNVDRIAVIALQIMRGRTL